MTPNAFLSYCHCPADDKHLARLLTHLEPLRLDGTLNTWSDRDIQPGSEFEQEIFRNLNKSNLFIALVSPDSLASDFCKKELQQALALQKAGKIYIVPVILETCDWKSVSSPLKKFQALPKDGEAISGWSNENDAYYDVAMGLRCRVAPNATAGRTGWRSPKQMPRWSSGMALVYTSRRYLVTKTRLSYVRKTQCLPFLMSLPCP